MSWLTKLIRFLFLTKEIISKSGELHFRRYRLLNLFLFKIFIHHILVSDYDDHFHDHPWNFKSLILKGSYREDCTIHPSHNVVWSSPFTAGCVIEHRAEDTHKLTLTSSEVWTFVIAWGWPREWGYQTQFGWIHHKEYRRLKNEGKL